MMDLARFAFLDQVLIALSRNYPGSTPFEEIMEVFYSISSTAVSSSSAIEKEAKLLDALLELEILGLVAVNSDTDETSLTVLGFGVGRRQNFPQVDWSIFILLFYASSHTIIYRLNEPLSLKLHHI